VGFGIEAERAVEMPLELARDLFAGSGRDRSAQLYDCSMCATRPKSVLGAGFGALVTVSLFSRGKGS
jgi:hypothetical protein